MGTDSSIKNNPFIEIKTDEELQDFLKHCRYFHDDIMKELHIINNSFVKSPNVCILSEKINVRLLLQTAWTVSQCVEILIGGARIIRIIGSGNGIMHSTGSFHCSKVNGEVTIDLELDGNQFQCERLLYRFVPDYFGRETKFGEEIILDDLDDIGRIDDEWAMCKRCGEAWQFHGRKVLVCPKCGPDPAETIYLDYLHEHQE